MKTYIADSLDGKIYYVAEVSGEWYIFLSEPEDIFGTRLVSTSNAWRKLEANTFLEILEGFKELANKLEDFESEFGDFKIDEKKRVSAPRWLALDDYETDDIPCLHTPSGRIIKITPLEDGLSMADGEKDLLDEAQSFYLKYVKRIQRH